MRPRGKGEVSSNGPRKEVRRNSVPAQSAGFSGHLRPAAARSALSRQTGGGGPRQFGQCRGSGRIATASEQFEASPNLRPDRDRGAGGDRGHHHGNRARQRRERSVGNRRESGQSTSRHEHRPVGAIARHQRPSRHGSNSPGRTGSAGIAAPGQALLSRGAIPKHPDPEQERGNDPEGELHG